MTKLILPRRKLLLGGAALMASPAIARAGSMMLTGVGALGSSAPAFVGPGDVISGATVALCLSAYSNATIGQNLIKITRLSDSTSQTFASLPNGKIDFAGISTFLTSTTGVCTQWIDQISGNLFVSATVTPTVVLNPTGLGTGTISLDFSGGGLLDSSTGITVSQPFFISGVAKRVSGTNYSSILSAIATSPGLLFNNSANNILLFAGSNNPLSAPGLENAWHSISGLFKDASSASQGYLDGSGLGTVVAGTGGYSATTVRVGAFSGSLSGLISEVFLYPSDVSASVAALSSNQHTRYGF